MNKDKSAWWAMPLALALLAPICRAAQEAPAPPEPPPDGPAVSAQASGPPPPGFGMKVLGYEGAFAGRKVVTGEPFSATAVTERVQVLADGNRIDQTSTAKEYRDSEGRTRREHILAPLGAWGAAKGLPPLIAINDPVAAVGYVLDSTNKVAFKHPLRNPDQVKIARHGMLSMAGAAEGTGSGPVTMGFATIMGGASVGDRKTEDLGTQVIQGVSAQGTRTTTTIPAGAIGNQRAMVIVEEKWVAPNLQITLMSKHSDPRFGEIDYRVTNLDCSEPDPALFQVPPDYTVKEGRALDFFRTNLKPGGGN